MALTQAVKDTLKTGACAVGNQSAEQDVTTGADLFGEREPPKGALNRHLGVAIPRKRTGPVHIEKKYKKNINLLPKGVVYYAGFKSIAR